MSAGNSFTPKSILFSPCHYAFLDGVEGSELSWAFNLADRVSSQMPGCSVITGYSEGQERLPYKVIEVQPHKNSLDFSATNALVFNLRCFWATVREARRRRYDVLHHVLPFRIGASFNLAFLLRDRRRAFVIGPIQTPLSVADDDLDPKAIRNTSGVVTHSWSDRTLLRLNDPLQFLSDATLNRADRIVAINAATRQMLLDRRVPAEKIVVIPPGIDTKLFSPNSRADHAGGPRLVTVSHLVRRKAVDLVIRGFADLKREVPEATLTVVGDGPQRPALEELARELGVADSVHFAGSMPNPKVREHYREADVFVSMSRSESWGQMYVEAMACGLPVVAARNIGAEEILRDGGGTLVPQGDHQAMADAVLELVREPEVFRSRAAAARQAAVSRFDWAEVIIPRYLALYDSLTGNGAARGERSGEHAAGHTRGETVPDRS